MEILYIRKINYYEIKQIIIHIKLNNFLIKDYFSLFADNERRKNTSE